MVAVKRSKTFLITWPISMGIIRLEGMEFFAYHGYHVEERTIGNRYEVNLEVEADFEEGAQTDRLGGTVDYGKLHQLVSERMAQPAKLLEHLAREMCVAIQAAFPFLSRVQVGVTKFNPPLGGICHKATVVYQLPINSNR